MNCRRQSTPSSVPKSLRLSTPVATSRYLPNPTKVTSAVQFARRRAAPQRFATAQKPLIDRHNFSFANLWRGVKPVRACAQRQSRRATPRFVCINRKAFDSAGADLNNGVHPVHRKGRQPVTPTDGAGAVPAGAVRRCWPSGGLGIVPSGACRTARCSLHWCRRGSSRLHPVIPGSAAQAESGSRRMTAEERRKASGPAYLLGRGCARALRRGNCWCAVRRSASLFGEQRHLGEQRHRLPSIRGKLSWSVKEHPDAHRIAAMQFRVVMAGLAVMTRACVAV